jgi:hypothetical protein
MPIAQGGQTIALVRLGVFGVANAKEGCLHQAHDRGEHPLPRQTAPPQIGLDALPDRRKNTAKSQHLAVFRLVADLAPPRVIAILLAAALVPSDRLDMAVWIGADPYRSPGGRDRQRTNALQGIEVAHQPPVGQAVVEAISRLVPRNPGHIVADMPQLGEFRRRQRIERRLECGSPVIPALGSMKYRKPGSGRPTRSSRGRDGQGSDLPTPPLSAAFRSYRGDELGISLRRDSRCK